MSTLPPKDEVIGQRCCGYLKIRGAALQGDVKGDLCTQPQASEGEAQHGPFFCQTGHSVPA